ncbi:hypothetical protein BGX21_010999 [Mortierella sp. AD011]|nr:hypothetical protein BGX21_010999 [Mortierella sp. AD011]
MTILHDSPKLQSLVFFEGLPEYPRKVPFLDLGRLTTETTTHLSMNRPWACRQTLQILRLGVFSPREPASTELRMAFMRQIGQLAVLRELGICNTPLYILYNSMNQPLQSHCSLYAQIHHDAIDKVSISRSTKKQDKLRYEEKIEDNADPSLRIIHDVLDRTHDRHAVVQIQQNEVEDGYISPNMNDAVLEDEGAELEGWAIELLEILKKGLHDSDSIVRSREMVNGLQEIVEKFYAFPRTISTSDNESRKRQRYFHN